MTTTAKTSKVEFDFGITPRVRTLRAIYDRHATRSYKPEQPTDEAIRSVLDAAVHAPSALGEEPWRFVIVQDRDLLHRISERAKAMAIADAADHGNRLKPPGAPGDGVRSLLADPAFNIFYDAGTLVAICAKVENPFVAADCWLAAENLMLAATADGLGSCPIGFAIGALNTHEFKTLLRIPNELTVVAPIILGIPKGDVPPVPRRAPVVLSWTRTSE